MAVINEVLAAKDESAEVVPTGTVTDVLIEKSSTGQIFLQAKVPGGNWTNVTSQRGAYAVATPDTTILYRFAAFNISASTRVYFGAA